MLVDIYFLILQKKNTMFGFPEATLNEDYSKMLTNVVTEMLSNTEDFSDINQYINDNFWDLV